MARMHSRSKGKAGSNKPAKLVKKAWIGRDAAEVEALVVKLAKEGNSPSMIGMKLRDSYGVPSVKMVCGKTILQILKEKKMNPKMPEDLSALFRKVLSIRKHLESNHKDQTAKRGLILTESKIRRLVKYYKREGVIPASWKYEPDKISFYLE
ncbi:MAG: 30S ribosomal protein S15 [Candidatus Woesearchaeota archaeon]